MPESHALSPASTRDRLPAQPVAIGIMGTPASSGNRGVLALGAALAKLCLRAGPNHHVMLFGSHRNSDPVTMRPEGRALAIPMVHWRMSLQGGWRNHLGVILLASLAYRLSGSRTLQTWLSRRIPWIGALEKTAFVGDVRGGDSFSDIYGMKRFIIATLPVLSVLWVKGGIVLFPQTYGPYKSPLARAIARFIVRRSQVVVARDRESRRIAQELAGDTQLVLLSPDVAFALHADRPEHVELDPPRSGPLPPGLVGLNINGLMFNGGYTGKNMFGLKLQYDTFAYEVLVALLEAHPGEILLVPHTLAAPDDPESDNGASAKLRDRLPAEQRNRVRIVAGDYDAHQLKGIIGACEFFVGSRMHACIAALSQGVPCVGVAYSMKFAGVFESVGVGDWVVDGRTAGNADAVAAVLACLRERRARQPALAREAEAARGRLTETFAHLTAVATKGTE
ncbi:MAG: hypothetical protein B9S34_09525 [Opitutia bacterium Tous-C1TDCM]|nr:MAG: hypothetical protein B9S34_09525 [Opitutae bacterium Tous-C1TDCM]